jgi:hypothetical protein
MLATLLALSLAAEPSAWCENIRAVRRLAQRDALDDHTLATLERRYCVSMPAPQPEPAPAQPGPSESSVTSDCADLWTMAVLLRAGRDTNQVGLVDAQVHVSCTAGAGNLGLLRWPNGRVAKSGGAWWYPSGRMARNASTWWYPNGRVARNGEAWWFPNGRMARNGDVWFDPETGKASSSDALLTWHCTAHPDLCNPRLEAMRGVPDEARSAGIIELLLATP